MLAGKASKAAKACGVLSVNTEPAADHGPGNHFAGCSLPGWDGSGIAQGQRRRHGGRSVQHHIGGVELVQLQIGKLATCARVKPSLPPYPAMTRRSHSAGDIAAQVFCGSLAVASVLLLQG